MWVRDACCCRPTPAARAVAAASMCGLHVAQQAVPLLLWSRSSSSWHSRVTAAWRVCWRRVREVRGVACPQCCCCCCCRCGCTGLQGWCLATLPGGGTGLRSQRVRVCVCVRATAPDQISPTRGLVL
jgi:hypothetical protein